MDNKEYLNHYQLWRETELGDPELLKELNTIGGEDSEIFDRFYKDIEFGTGGLRGIIGAGTNRMNVVTVGRVTAGLAAHVRTAAGENGAVAIAYDSRINSELFARRAASVLAATGVKAHIFTEISATPLLSFAVRELGCTAGIVITASHNPAEYNGYKVYGPDGAQLDTADSEALYKLIQEVDPFKVPALDFEQGLKQGIISYIKDELTENFLNCSRSLSMAPGVLEKSELKVVYTPLYGTGMKPVEQLVKNMGLSEFYVVPEQREPNGHFPTAPYPNPEDPAALALALELARKKGADMVVATDPDADRLSVAVAHGGGIVQLSGNQMGCLMLDYIANNLKISGKMPANPVALRSVVSTPMFDAIARHYGIAPISVLTGFKNIAQQVRMLDGLAQTNRYIFGFEESNGFMPGSFVRDKDGVSAALLFCEMAAVEKLKGRTLVDRLNELYETCGYYSSLGKTFTFPGAAGMEKMAAIMSGLRSTPPGKVGSLEVARVDDYSVGFEAPGLIGGGLLPPADMLIFTMADNSTAIVRPSGTEPKLKLYVVRIGSSAQEALALANRLADDFSGVIESIG